MSVEEKDLVYSTEDLVYIVIVICYRLVSNEDKAMIEALMSDEEFLALMEVKHGTSNRLNHAVNPSKDIVIQQEVAEFCITKEVCSILEVRESKPEDENFKETMLPEDQESGQERIIQENNPSLSDNIYN